MHGIHHADVQELTNSNWSSLFTCWDVLHRTFIYGVVCLPSSDQLPEFVPLLDRSQVVHADALSSRAERQRRALDIVGDATKTQRPAPKTSAPSSASLRDIPVQK